MTTSTATAITQLSHSIADTPFMLAADLIYGFVFVGFGVLLAASAIVLSRDTSEAKLISILTNKACLLPVLCLFVVATGGWYGYQLSQAAMQAGQIVEAVTNPAASAAVEMSEGANAKIKSVTVSVRTLWRDETVSVLGKPMDVAVKVSPAFEAKITAEQLAILEKNNIKLATSIASQIQSQLAAAPVSVYEDHGTKHVSHAGSF